MTDDEIEALAKKHLAPHADRLDAIMKNPVPYQQTEQFRRVKALIADVLSKLRAPVADERISLRGAANLAFNALHECKPAKGAEKQYSDAIQALQSALHDIAYTVNRTATPQQFADHLQREARAALASAPVAGERELFQRNDTLISFAVSLAEETLGKSVTPKDYVAAGVFVEKERQARAALASAPAHGDAIDTSPKRVDKTTDDRHVASAPVAGEADEEGIQAIAHEFLHPSDDETGHDYFDWLGFARALLSRNAAPQASEAVRDALQKLVDMYVLNQGSDHEHITCYTPLPASHLTPKQRAKSETWKAWDDARAALSAQPGAQKEQSNA